MARSMINKILVLSGGLAALTGLFLLFHYESHFALAAHQLGGLIFVVFCIRHLISNWKATLKSFNNDLSKYLVVAVFVVSVIIMFATGNPRQ